MVNVVIADGSPLSRVGLNTVLSGFDGISIVGETSNSGGLIELLKDVETDVVLIDYVSKGFDVDLIGYLKLAYPKVKCVAITTAQSGLTILHALRAGIDSYVKKDCDFQEIVDAVRETGMGSKFFCGQILETIAKEGINIDDLSLKEFSCEAIHLSDRELEVISLIAEGYTNLQIADKLFLSSHTVNTHRKNIMQKIGVNNTAAMVMYAVKTGVVSPNRYFFSKQV